MCGIAGYFGPNPVSEEALARCEALMRRRGPDGHGRYGHERQGRHVQLLHSRLSIIDLDHRADQPFRVGSQVTVFNGEIYNYLELRAALTKGHSFHTESDTEILATLLAEEGVDGLDRCEGMWAFARYDEADGSLLLSRDRFGEKPLYIVEEEGGIYFGSEVKFIAALRGRPLEPDLDQVRRFLVNGYKSLYKGKASFFARVSELAPATAALIGADGARRDAVYWMPTFLQDQTMGFADAVAQVREALIHSVGLRLRADVPLAFCMSGGVDSTALISIAKRVYGYDVHGFTVVNTDERYEEQEAVEAVVGELGIRHTSIGLDRSDFLPKLRSLVAAHDAPIYTISYYAHWLLLCSIAGHGYKISISGTAADELFSGYFDHHNAYLAAVRGDEPLHARALADWQAHVRPTVRNPYLSDADLFVRDAKFRDHIYLDAEKFSARLSTPFAEPFAERAYCAEILRNRMANELFHEAVPVILHEDDLNAMYYSVENRSPFLDRGLFELSTRIPTRHLMRGGYAKAVLREAVRGIAPDVVVDNHRKVGFNAPILDLLDLGDPEVRGFLLEDGPIFELVRREAIEQMLGKGNFPNSESKFLFNFLCSKIFLENSR